MRRGSQWPAGSSQGEQGTNKNFTLCDAIPAVPDAANPNKERSSTPTHPSTLRVAPRCPRAAQPYAVSLDGEGAAIVTGPSCFSPAWAELELKHN